MPQNHNPNRPSQSPKEREREREKEGRVPGDTDIERGERGNRSGQDPSESERDVEAGQPRRRSESPATSGAEPIEQHGGENAMEEDEEMDRSERKDKAA